MSKSTYKRKHFIGGLLTVSEGESTITAENMAAGRYGPGAAAESLKI